MENIGNFVSDDVIRTLPVTDNTKTLFSEVVNRQKGIVDDVRAQQLNTNPSKEGWVTKGTTFVGGKVTELIENKIGSKASDLAGKNAPDVIRGATHAIVNRIAPSFFTPETSWSLQALLGRGASNIIDVTINQALPYVLPLITSGASYGATALAGVALPLVVDAAKAAYQRFFPGEPVSVENLATALVLNEILGPEPGKGSTKYDAKQTIQLVINAVSCHSIATDILSAKTRGEAELIVDQHTIKIKTDNPEKEKIILRNGHVLDEQEKKQLKVLKENVMANNGIINIGNKENRKIIIKTKTDEIEGLLLVLSKPFKSKNKIKTEDKEQLKSLLSTKKGFFIHCDDQTIMRISDKTIIKIDINEKKITNMNEIREFINSARTEEDEVLHAIISTNTCFKMDGDNITHLPTGMICSLNREKEDGPPVNIKEVQDWMLPFIKVFDAEKEIKTEIIEEPKIIEDYTENSRPIKDQIHNFFMKNKGFYLEEGFVVAPNGDKIEFKETEEILNWIKNNKEQCDLELENEFQIITPTKEQPLKEQEQIEEEKQIKEGQQQQDAVRVDSNQQGMPDPNVNPPNPDGGG